MTKPHEEAPHIDPPIFESDVPPQLLAGKTDDEKWLYQKMSIVLQQNDWLIYRLRRWSRVVAQNSINVTDLRDDLDAIKAWRKGLRARWGTILAIGVLVFPSAVVILWEIFKHHAGWEK